MLKQMRFFSVVLSLLVLMAGCGGSNSSSTTSQGRLRLINITTASDLELSADDSQLVSGIGSGAVSAYQSLNAESWSLIASSASATLAASASTSLTVSGDTDYSLVAYQRNGAIKTLLLTDDNTAPSSGYSLLTLAHMATDAGAVDVYLVPHGADVTDYSATFSSVAASSSDSAQTVNAGTYDIVVTAAGKPEDVRLTMQSITLSSKELATLILTGTSGGALVNGALVEEGGDVVAMQQADKARVRLVGGFGNDGSTVAVSLADGSLLGALASPSIGLYTLVSADTSIDGITMTSGSTSTDVASLPTVTFASGGDYTLLVYGTAASPQVSVLTDNNQAPTSSSLAKIRLVNAAVATSSGGLTLTDNFQQVATSTAFGGASSYSSVATGQSQLVISSPLATFNAYTIFGANDTLPYLYSQGVYTVFALQADPQVMVLSKDR
jgi:hypothetical protein